MVWSFGCNISLNTVISQNFRRLTTTKTCFWYWTNHFPSSTARYRNLVYRPTGAKFVDALVAPQSHRDISVGDYLNSPSFERTSHGHQCTKANATSLVFHGERTGRFRVACPFAWILVRYLGLDVWPSTLLFSLHVRNFVRFGFGVSRAVASSTWRLAVAVRSGDIVA